MKTKITLLICTLLIGGFTQLAGQEVKKERKIRIETIDENGKKVVIDTTLTSEGNVAIMKMDDGKVIIHKSVDNKGVREIVVTSEGEGHKTIHMGSDQPVIIKENVKIVNGDTIVWTSKSPEKGRMVFISEDGVNAHPDHATWTMNSPEGNVIIMEKSEGKDKKMEVKVISVDEKGKHMEGYVEGKEVLSQSKYVFVKDGITISVSGSDEAKVKDVVEKIKKSVDLEKTAEAPAEKAAPVKSKKK